MRIVDAPRPDVAADSIAPIRLIDIQIIDAVDGQKKKYPALLNME